MYNIFLRLKITRLNSNFVSHTLLRINVRFHAVIRFTYGPQQGCGGDQFIRGTSSKTIRSHDANNDGKYENEMDCQWLIIGDAGKALKLTFTTFNLEAAGTNPSGEQECFDFVEVNIFFLN